MANHILQNKNILAIDDSPTIRLLLHHLLTEYGAIIKTASSGIEGLNLYHQSKFDLILLDLQMPGMNGLEVLKQIRDQDETTTIVMLTGTGGVKAATEAVRAGADHYIEKSEISMDKTDYTDFFYALNQAFDHRFGYLAQKQLQDMKADFHAMVTHDLRNPTNTILLATQILKSKGVEKLPPDYQQVFGIIEQAADKLMSLINNYLDFARMDAGYLRLNRREIDLCDMVKSSVQLATLPAHSKNQTLDMHLPPRTVPAMVDGERLQQVLDNLISNAIKYTPAEGAISVTLLVNGKSACFEVQDNGPGIPPSQLNHLFERYHRVPGEVSHQETGTGLGLLITKEIVESHGGTVWVESEGIMGKGSKFAVKIPLMAEV